MKIIYKTRATASVGRSGRARQPDAARHAAVHAVRAGDRNGALFGSRHFGRPWRGRLGNGEALVAVSSSSVRARYGSASPPKALARSAANAEGRVAYMT
jgi:hypothetical protein